MSTQSNSKASRYFSTRDLLIMSVLAALGGVASTYINTLSDAIHAALGFPGATQWAAGLHVIWIVLSVGILQKPGTGTLTGILKGTVELMSGNSHGVIILLVNLVGGLLVDFGFLLFRDKKLLWPYLVAGGLATGSNVLVFQIFATLPLNILGLSAIIILFFVAFVSGLVFAGILPIMLINSLINAGVVRVPEGSKQKRKIGWWIISSVSVLAILLAIFLRINLQGPATVRISGDVETPTEFPTMDVNIDLQTRQMEYRGVLTEYQGYPLEKVIMSANPKASSDTLLIEASDGYSFLISFDEINTNENILLVKSGQGKNSSFDIVGPESSKAWIRNVTSLTVIAAQGLQIVDLQRNTHEFDPDQWLSDMDSTQISLPSGPQKLQGVPVWKILTKSIDTHGVTEITFSTESEHQTISWTEVYNNDSLRVFTAIQGEKIEYVLATMSGEVQLFPLRKIEVQ